jgi:hypothetical protein
VVLTWLLYRFLCWLVRVLVRGGGVRDLEIVVLHHQLAILRRGGRRPRYTTADRALFAAASRLLPRERRSCFAVSPKTLRRWHRALLQRNRRRRRRRPGRPPLAAGTRSLILRMGRENPRWGYVRIQGELLKLGITVSATTVATVLRASGLGPAPRRTGPSWSAFLRAQAQSMLGGGLHSAIGDAGFEGAAAGPSGPAEDREAAQWKLTTSAAWPLLPSLCWVLTCCQCGATRCGAFSLRPEGRCACRNRIDRMPATDPPRAGRRSSNKATAQTRPSKPPPVVPSRRH